MKTIKYLALVSLASFTLASCGDFGDTNIDPEHLNEGRLHLFRPVDPATLQYRLVGLVWPL